MTRTPLILGALAVLAAPHVHAQDGLGEVVLTTAVPFLQIEPDSRASGMGMAGVAVADNAYAPYWNPAGLAGQTGTEVSFTHAPWLPALGANLSYEHLSGKHSLGSAGTLGGHLTYFDLGTQIATDEQGNEIDEFSSYEFALGLSYGYPVTENLSVGTGLRLIYSNLTGGLTVGGDQTSAGTSVGVDLGVKYTGPELGLGQSSRPTIAFNLANMGPGISYVNTSTSTSDSTRFPDAIPTTLRMGLALDTHLDEFNRILLALDLNKVVVNRDPVTGEYDPFYKALFTSWESCEIKTVRSEDTVGIACDELAQDENVDNDCRVVSGLRSLTLGTGLEYWYNDLLALRAGYFYEDPANGNRQFLTFGTGIRYSLVGVDISYIYALEENSPLADQLRFSLLLNIPR